MIRAAANVHLTPCTLELGGKSPTYFDDSGDLEVNPIIIIISISITIIIIILISITITISIGIIILYPDQSEKASLGKVQQLWSNLRCSGLHPLLKSRRRVIFCIAVDHIGNCDDRDLIQVIWGKSLDDAFLLLLL